MCVARAIEITPWKEEVWGVSLFTEGGGEESVRVGNRNTLAFG